MTRRALAAVAIAGVLLAACSTESPKEATSKWTSSAAFGQAAGDLLNDYAQVRIAVDHHDTAKAVRTECEYLFTDANNENTDILPTPDPQLTNLLSSAEDGFIHASGQCIGDPGDLTLQRQVLTECQVAIGSLVAAVTRDEAVTGTPLVVKGIK
jgi:hypothetical protein